MANIFTKGLQGLGIIKSTPVGSPLTSSGLTDTFQLIGGGYTYSFGKKNNFLEDYRKCPPLSSIIGRKTNAFTNGEVRIVDRDTGEEAKNMGSWYELLENPNPLQTQTQFESQLYTYLHIYGYAIVMKTKPYGYEKDLASISGLWVLPNDNLNITWNENPYYLTTKQNRIKKIEFNINGRLYPIRKEDVYMFTHLNACYTGNINLPDSPLCGLEYPISNIILSYEASGSLIKNNGAMGILSNKGEIPGIGHARVGNDDIEQLQRDYSRKYGLGKDQFKVIITSMNLDYQQMGMAIKDLMLSEQNEENTKVIADKLGYPTDLLGIGSSSTYENANQASKDLYDMTIIPEAMHFYTQFTEMLFNGMEMNVRLDSDYSHVPAMQEDEAEKARAAKDWSYAYEKYWKSDLMTRNQILEEQDKEPIEGGDLYYTEWLKTLENGQEGEA